MGLRVASSRLSPHQPQIAKLGDCGENFRISLMLHIIRRQVHVRFLLFGVDGIIQDMYLALSRAVSLCFTCVVCIGVGYSIRVRLQRLATCCNRSSRKARKRTLTQNIRNGKRLRLKTLRRYPEMYYCHVYLGPDIVRDSLALISRPMFSTRSIVELVSCSICQLWIWPSQD